MKEEEKMEQLPKQLSLSEVKTSLESWRSNKKGRYIPTEIKQQIVELLSEYSAGYLQRELGINGKSIKAWKSESNTAPIFIRLTEPVKKQSECLLLKFSLGNLSVEGSLSVESWKSALELLSGVDL